jgi:hypothetical protein
MSSIGRTQYFALKFPIPRSVEVYQATAAEWQLGSKADICAANSHVRFTPESGPLMAQSGHLLFDQLVGAGDGLCLVDFTISTFGSNLR